MNNNFNENFNCESFNIEFYMNHKGERFITLPYLYPTNNLISLRCDKKEARLTDDASFSDIIYFEMYPLLKEKSLRELEKKMLEASKDFPLIEEENFVFYVNLNKEVNISDAYNEFLGFGYKMKQLFTKYL